MDFKINRDSWHYRLNKNFFNAYEDYMDAWERRHADFCSYWRATFFRVVWVIAVTVGVLGLLTGFGAVAWKNPAEVLVAIGILGATVLLSIGFSTLNEKIRNNRDGVERPPGLIKTKYRAWKGRYCPKVTYDE